MTGALAVREGGVCCEGPVRGGAAGGRGAAGLRGARADPTRLGIAAALRQAGTPICVCDLTATFGLSQPTISHHMARLRTAGPVDSRRQGIWTYYSLRSHLDPQAEAPLPTLVGDPREAPPPPQPPPPPKP